MAHPQKTDRYKERASPTKDARVKSVMRGILRTKGEYQAHASPTLLNHIKTMIESLPDNTKGIRDKAILLLGFAGGFRRSELVSLNIEDLSLADEGLVIKLTKSKTDQTGRGRTVAIGYEQNKDTCPVEALRGWLEASGIRTGPLFAP